MLASLCLLLGSALFNFLSVFDFSFISNVILFHSPLRFCVLVLLFSFSYSFLGDGVLLSFPQLFTKFPPFVYLSSAHISICIEILLCSQSPFVRSLSGPLHPTTFYLRSLLPLLRLTSPPSLRVLRNASPCSLSCLLPQLFSGYFLRERGVGGEREDWRRRERGGEEEGNKRE